MRLSFFKKKSAEEKFKEKLAGYQRAAADKSGDFRAHIKIAELYLAHGRGKEAVDAYLMAAHACQEKRLFQIAVTIYTQILSVDPGRVEIYTELAGLHLRNGFRGDGVAVLEKLAEYHHASGNDFEAAQIIGKIREIDPHSKFFKSKVAKFLTTKELDEEKTLRAGPADKWHLTGQGSSALAKNIRLGGGEGLFDLATALSSDDDMDVDFEPDELCSQSAHAEDLQPDEVFNQLATIMATNPDQDTPAFHYNLGLAYQRCNQIERALHEYQRALDGVPRKLECYKRLIDCHVQLKQYDRAQQMVKAALSVQGISERDTLDLVYQTGLIYKYCGDYKRAVKVFKKIYSIDQNFRSVAQEVKQLCSALCAACAVIIPLCLR